MEAKRTIKTELVLIGKDEYIYGINELTQAINRASDAKKRFDALFGKAPNPQKWD